MRGNPLFGSSQLSLGYGAEPKRKRLLTAADRKRIAARQGYKCAKCRITFGIGGYHVDHIKRFSDGGSDKDSNLQALCPNCHSEKTENERHRIKQKKITAHEKKQGVNPIFGGGSPFGSLDIGKSKRSSPSINSFIGGPNLFGESTGRRKKPKDPF
jgi:hypothetical protein